MESKKEVAEKQFSGNCAKSQIMAEPLVTILIPHYKTPEVTKICLRLLRKNTDINMVRVIVIYNGSQDVSYDYLKKLSWIEIIERKNKPGDSPSVAHAKALDLGLTRVNTPYVLSIHTDTFVKHPLWLNVLLEQIENKPDVASVGSWKLEAKPWFKYCLKAIEKNIQLPLHWLMGHNNHEIEGHGGNYYYLRSHCALYRTDLIRKYQLTFSTDRESVGKVMHKKLQEYGYKTIFLPSDLLCRYIYHLNHATMVLNPQLGSSKKSIIKGEKRIRHAFRKLEANKVLNDGSLDL